MYYTGDGVGRDMERTKHYYELAAMKGYATARYNLGAFEQESGNIDRTLRHYMIGVESGEQDSLTEIKQLYSNRKVTKDEYTEALRAYQQYISEVKSVREMKQLHLMMNTNTMNKQVELSNYFFR